MMKRIMNWVFAATLICGTMTVGFGLTACSDAHVDGPEEAKVQSTELIRTSKSWDGVDLPDYLEGRPELVAVK